MDYCPRDATALISAVTATQADLESSLAQHFRIVRRLGGGGMGTVFLAEQIAVGNRPVALKVLLRKLLDDPEFLVRFRNEAASTGRIDHPNVVTIYESGQADDGTPYIAMQYLEGESLRARLKARGALPVEECNAIVGQAARGLNAAHKLGIIHRDLKPDNIFLCRAEDVGEGSALPREPGGLPYTVKLVDFGIAKLRESATHTLTGTVLGTPAYMSFEQASGMKSEELDARSDIYSFGVVAYEMLTGRVPFHSDTPLGYVRKHLSEEPPPFRAARPQLAAPQLEQVVMKALAKDREARYRTVLEFARAFSETAQAVPKSGIEVRTPLPSTKVMRPPEDEVVRRVVASPQPAGAPLSTPSPRPVPPVSGRAPLAPSAAQPKSRAALWSGMAAFLLLLVLGVWYFSSRSPSGSGSSGTQPGVGNPPAVQSKTGSPSTDHPSESVPATQAGQPTSSSGEVKPADRRGQIQAARTRGDSYYENGDYDNAIRAYQVGLSVDPGNRELKTRVQRARSAKAAEESLGKQ